ncbi:DNA polymerase IV [Candidatus Sumerlaeota bacterium]
MRARVILHIDLDAFFVEVERLVDPALVGKPVIVGGQPDGRGVVCSASYEARAFGVRSAMPMGRARQLCPQAELVRVGRGDYEQYSRRVRQVLEGFSPVIEMRSIDEGFLDLTGCERLHGSPLETAHALRARIMGEVGLPASCGLAANKLVAKVASDCAKPKGILWVRDGGEQQFLKPLLIYRLPGIGKSLGQKLERYGVATLGDLQRLGAEALSGALGERAGAELYERACGQDDSPLTPTREARSVSRETTFETDTCHLPTLETTLSSLSERVAAGLRRINCRARTVSLKLRYADFKTLSRSQTLPNPTDDDRAIFRAARESLQRCDLRRVRVRLLGVAATKLLEGERQLDFLEEDRMQREGRLAHALDRIKERHGSRAIERARSHQQTSPPPGQDDSVIKC